METRKAKYPRNSARRAAGTSRERAPTVDDDDDIYIYIQYIYIYTYIHIYIYIYIYILWVVVEIMAPFWVPKISGAVLY